MLSTVKNTLLIVCAGTLTLGSYYLAKPRALERGVASETKLTTDNKGDECPDEASSNLAAAIEFVGQATNCEHAYQRAKSCAVWGTAEDQSITAPAVEQCETEIRVGINSDQGSDAQKATALAFFEAAYAKAVKKCDGKSSAECAICSLDALHDTISHLAK